MSTTTGIKAAEITTSTLPILPAFFLCLDHINGFCRRGDKCTKGHEICAVPPSEPQPARLICQSNYLFLEPRYSPPGKQPFEDDGPGYLSKYGPRHDNDYVHIEDIRILPTTDEILCKRLPYMPRKDPYAHHHLPCGQQRLLDVHFRHLRYESTESLIDSCYHASQKLTCLVSEPHAHDYDYRMVTMRGFRYSLFRDVVFEEIIFNHQKGITLRVSFACPKGLRGRRLGPSKHLEEGMLVALIGLDGNSSLSITFMEIYQRQTTDAMRPRSGNDLRASAILNFADPGDIVAVRRLLYNSQGLLQEKFVLVEIPSALYAGFYWTLKQLQNQSRSEESLAFQSTIAPSEAGASPEVSPPAYTNEDGFAYQLDALRTKGAKIEADSLTLKPMDMSADHQAKTTFIDSLCRQTTLDRGQATALSENLCRGFAFSQGPPGSGKTFLGVSLAKVLLASRSRTSQKPILVVCMTNHALDSYLDDLRIAGMKKLARLGRGSKETWTQEHRLSTLSQRMPRTTFERTSLKQSHNQMESLTTEGTSWCESLNTHVLSWPAVRDLLKSRYPAILDRFASLERVDESSLSDIRLARKAGGFAFEFWCIGGDIKDINRLLEKFSSMLGNNHGTMDGADDREIHSQQRVVSNIIWNAHDAAIPHGPSETDVWQLNITEREKLLRKWKEEIDPQTILDRTAEIHRRHHAAIITKRKVRQDIDARCLAKQDVIGMTTTACAMNWSMLSQIALQIVICEEAGEVMEAQSLCTLFPSVEHAIFIGDPLQLRPQVNEQALSLETDLGASYRLDESLMERMMLPATVGTLPIASSRLDIQRRMHPEIADIMRATLYSYLKDHESTYNRAPVPVMADRVWWLDHQVPEDAPDPRSSKANSFSNAFEVEMVVGFVEHLVNTNEYDFKDITILTPYNGQLAAFTERLSGTCSIWLSEKDRDALVDDGLLDPEGVQLGGKTDVQISSMLRLATIDNFQGEESRVVILSAVRSNPEGRVGFLRTPNRINVGCSRARDGFYIVGNASLMRGVGMWREIVDVLSAKGKIGPAFRTCCPRHPDHVYSVHSPDQWYRIPECQVPCGIELPCGHVCNMRCHAESLHERVGCNELCPRHFEGCNHPCTKTCGDRCGDCSFQVKSVILPCGHEASPTCAEIQNAAGISCRAKLDSVQMPCGHWHERQCSNRDETLKCAAKCNRVLKCGHSCGESCHNCTLKKHHSRCTSACSKVLPCGHHCAAPCHLGECPPCSLPCQRSCRHDSCKQICSTVCDPCVQSCEWTCPHIKSCTTICCLPCDRTPCNEPCTEVLPCGHLCPSLCGERCPSRCLQCVTGEMPAKTQIFLPCGHHFDLEVLDNHIGISKLYQLDDNGRISKAIMVIPERISPNQLLDVNPSCPTCGYDCKDVRRYALFHQLSALKGNLDRLYSKFCRKLHIFMDNMYKTKTELDKNFDTISMALRPGPLTGRKNEEIVRNRGNALVGLEQQIVRFRDTVVQRFEDNVPSITAFLGIPVKPDEIDVNSSYRLRFDALFYRCRLIVLEESLRMFVAMKTIRNTSQHTLLMTEGIRRMTVSEAQARLAALRDTIAECESRGMKRLEAEFRLLQLCFHIVLKDAGVPSELEVESSLCKVWGLCRAYPDSAGLLTNTYVAMKDHIRGVRRNMELYSSRNIWWSWPRHITGNLQHCSKYAHPYSGTTWDDCPECGREVRKLAALDPNRLLKENDFVAAIKTQSLNGKSWRV